MNQATVVHAKMTAMATSRFAVTAILLRWQGEMQSAIRRKRLCFYWVLI
jgi:hypothetical protein